MEMDLGHQMSAIAIKHGKAMAVEMVESVLVQALEAAAKQSASPIDDIVVAALKEPLKKAMLDLIAKA